MEAVRPAERGLHRPERHHLCSRFPVECQEQPGVRRGIRIGSAKDGSVQALIPGIGPEPDKESVPEGVAADSMGNVYGAETSANDLKKLVKK